MATRPNTAILGRSLTTRNHHSSAAVIDPPCTATMPRPTTASPAAIAMTFVRVVPRVLEARAMVGIVRSATDVVLMRHQPHVSGDSDNACMKPTAKQQPTESAHDPRAAAESPPRRNDHRPTGASLIAVMGVAVAFVGVMVVHAVRSDVDPLREVMSHYANGSNGPLMSVVFYAFGVAALALAFRLRTAIDQHGVTRAFPVLLVLAGLALVTAGVFEVDRPLAPQTVEEVIHSNSAVAAFVMLIVAMLLFSLACRSDRRWWSVRWASLGLAVTAAAAAVGTQLAGGSNWSGGIQRVLAGAVLAWFLLTALHVRRKAFGAS